MVPSMLNCAKAEVAARAASAKLVLFYYKEAKVIRKAAASLPMLTDSKLHTRRLTTLAYFFSSAASFFLAGKSGRERQPYGNCVPYGTNPRGWLVLFTTLRFSDVDPICC